MSDYTTQQNQAVLSLYDLIIAAGGSVNEDISTPRLTLIGGVKVRIDELMPEGEGIQFDVSGLTNVSDPIDLLINALLDESTVNIYQIAPIDKIVGKSATSPTAVANDPDDGSGYVELPTDFIRLQSFKLSLWNRPVTVLYTPQDKEYKRQFTVLKGGKVKPACILSQKVISSTVKKVIKYFSLSVGDTHTVEEFIYVPVVTAENCQTNLIESMLWMCAAKILQITGRINESIKANEQVLIQFKNL